MRAKSCITSVSAKRNDSFKQIFSILYIPNNLKIVRLLTLHLYYTCLNNMLGLVTKMTDSAGVTNYTYDSFGRLTKEVKDCILKTYTYDGNNWYAWENKNAVLSEIPSSKISSLFGEFLNGTETEVSDLMILESWLEKHFQIRRLQNQRQEILQLELSVKRNLGI